MFVLSTMTITFALICWRLWELGTPPSDDDRLPLSARGKGAMTAHKV